MSGAEKTASEKTADRATANACFLVNFIINESLLYQHKGAGRKAVCAVLSGMAAMFAVGDGKGRL